MSVRTALTLVALTWFSTWPAQAQIPFDKSELPTHSALNRVGLERHWNQVVQLGGTERVIGLSMSAASTPITGVVNDAAPAPASFKGGYELAPFDGAYKNFQLLITSGPMKGEMRPIIGYQGETRTFQFGKPFAAAPEKNTKFILLDAMVFAQTTENNFYAYNGETGQLLWKIRAGNPIGKAFPASVNSRAVFATSGNKLVSIDRQSGERLWSVELPSTPTSPTACDEDLVIVGLDNGKVIAYHTRASATESKVVKYFPVKIGSDAYPNGVTPNMRDHALLTEPIRAWVRQTDGPFKSRPIATTSMVFIGGGDGRVYACFPNDMRNYYRFLTGGAVSGPLASFGVRTLLIPSMDNNLYSVDIFTGVANWVYASGAPIVQEPLVAGEDIFVQNTAGNLTVLDEKTGEARWSTATNDAILLGVGKSKIYGRTWTGDLVVVDRKAGTILDGPQSTFGTKGLDIRKFSLTVTNSHTDRIYMATPSGSLICVREIDALNPNPLKDVNQPVFGYIPPEGYPATAPGTPATPPGDAPEPAEPPM